MPRRRALTPNVNVSTQGEVFVEPTSSSDGGGGGGGGDVGSNVFAGFWPPRPTVSGIVIWVGGGPLDNPSTLMEIGDLWFPSTEGIA